MSIGAKPMRKKTFLPSAPMSHSFRSSLRGRSCGIAMWTISLQTAPRALRCLQAACAPFCAALQRRFCLPMPPGRFLTALRRGKAFPRSARGSGSYFTCFRSILIFRVTVIWRSVLARCSDFVFWKISIIRTLPQASRTFGAAGTFHFPPGFWNMFIFPLAAIAAER